MSVVNGLLAGLNVVNLLVGVALGVVFGGKIRALVGKALVFVGGKL